jgi:hypothetical protein
VALAGGGGFLTWLALDKAGAANDLDPFQLDYGRRFDDTFASARNWAIGSYIAYGLGAAAFLVGLDILLGWPIPVGERRDSRGAVTWFPMALPGGSAMMVDVAF